MKNIPKLLFLWALLTLLNHSGLFAQTNVALLRDLAEENKKSVEALVLYPAEPNWPFSKPQNTRKSSLKCRICGKKQAPHSEL